jgi:hypothetical protein
MPRKTFGGGKSAGYHKKDKSQGRPSEDDAEGQAAEGDVPSAFPAEPRKEKYEPPAKRRKMVRERAAREAKSGKPVRPPKRLKPGAALALAVQSTAKTGAIQEGKGQKITFD